MNITVLDRATATIEKSDEKKYRTSVNYFFDDDTDWIGQEYGAIDKLSEDGGVSFSGTVKAVYPSEQVVIVRDSKDDTIDVYTIKRLQVKEGGEVVVQGQMVDEFAGLGREIVSARVLASKP